MRGQKWNRRRFYNAKDSGICLIEAGGKWFCAHLFSTVHPTSAGGWPNWNPPVIEICPTYNVPSADNKLSTNYACVFSWLSPLGSIQTCGSEAILLFDTYLWFSKVVQPRWYCYIAYHVMKPFEIHSAALGTLAVTTSQPADPFFTNQMIHRKGRWA